MRAFEREFLILLAPVWLACRWRLLGKALRRQDGWPAENVWTDLLGMVDYAGEMKLLCREVKNRA